MKKVIIVVLLFIPVICQGQSIRNENISISVEYSPGDTGFGLRVDMKDIYVSTGFGQYWLPYGGYIKDHYRVSVGYITHIPGYENIFLGVSYHQHGDIYDTVELTKRSLRKISFETGCKHNIGRAVVSLRFDVLRFEGIFGFGWTF